MDVATWKDTNGLWEKRVFVKAESPYACQWLAGRPPVPFSPRFRERLVAELEGYPNQWAARLCERERPQQTEFGAFS